MLLNDKLVGFTVIVSPCGVPRTVDVYVDAFDPTFVRVLVKYWLKGLKGEEESTKEG